jgi:hypothetical protein
MAVFVQWDSRLAQVETRGCQFVDNFISKLRESAQLDVPDTIGYISLKTCAGADIPGNTSIATFLKIYKQQRQQPILMQCSPSQRKKKKGTLFQPHSQPIVLPRENKRAEFFFRLRSEFTAETEIAEHDIILYLRPEVLELFTFISKEVLGQNKIGWIVGPPGTGKSSAAMSYVALDRKVGVVYTWISLIKNTKGAHVFRFEDGRKTFLSVIDSNIAAEIKELLQRDTFNEGKTHCVIVDGLIMNETSFQIEGILSSWHHDSKISSERRLLFVTSLSARYKQKTSNVNNEKEFFMFSWTYQQYQDAAKDEQFFQNVSDAFDITTTTTTKKEDLINDKFYYAGRSARYMFGLSTERVIEDIATAVQETDDFLKYLTGTIGIRSNTVINRLFATYQNSDGTRSNILVSRFAAVHIGMNAEKNLIENLIRALENSSNPSLDGWLFELLFFAYMKYNGIQLYSLADYHEAEFWQKSKFTVVDPTKNISNLLSSSHSGTWLKPIKYNQGGYDAIFVSRNMVRFIQITKAKKHTLKLRFFASFLQILKPKRKPKVEIVFIVDKLRLKTFKISVVEDEGALEPYDWKKGTERSLVTIRGAILGY